MSAVACLFGHARGRGWQAALGLLVVASLCADSHAQTDRYVYIDDLPEWASYAGDVMYKATQYWEERLPGTMFYQVDDQAQADFMVSWVKEFGGEHVGFALGTQFIEVGLGDSYCSADGRWSPYSSRHVTEIMAHEIGHVLGYGHSDDPSDIMYPIALNKEYGLIEREISTTSGYGHFEPFCTVKDVSSFAYHVSIDDPTYGFDVYVVPDGSALDKWAEGEAFEYYADSACFGENYLSYGGTCSGVSRNAGLLILSPDLLTEPLTSIRVQFQEAGPDAAGGVAQPEREALAQPEALGADESLTLFVDPMKMYTMQYPSSWSVYDPALDPTLDGAYDGPVLVTFFDDELYAEISLSLYDIGYSGLGDSEILEMLVDDERYLCETAAESGYGCSDFEVFDTYTSVLDSGLKAYNVEYWWTYWEDGQGYDTFARVAEVHSGTAAWYMLAETDSENVTLFYDLIDSVVGSFAFTASAPAPGGSSPNAVPTRAESEARAAGEAGTVAVEHDSYDVWQQGRTHAKVYGTVDPQYAGIRIALTYTYPDGRTEGKMISYTPPGDFETSFLLDSGSPEGTYEVMASVGDRIVGTDSFEVIQSPSPPDAPPQAGRDGLDEPDAAPQAVQDGPAQPDGAPQAPESYCGPGTEMDSDGVCQLSPAPPALEPPAAPDAAPQDSLGESGAGDPEPEPRSAADAAPQDSLGGQDAGVSEKLEPRCGPGTERGEDGVCQLIRDQSGGGCLVSTAAYGSELAVQVQRLREIRDNVHGTESGRAFMESFNRIYYVFSPAVADWERQSPAFKQAVRATLAPMLWSLSALDRADPSSEAEMAAYGAAVLLANAGMYAGGPAAALALAGRRLGKI